jgi:riboflavin biosynthesis RibT protein
MLIRYKKTMEKIAMGLLSFMPEHKEIKKLMDTMQFYDQHDDWQLYLWKKNDEYVGAIGVKVEDNTAIIQHITVIPSYRGEGVATEMISELCELDTVEHVRAIDEVQPFVQKCMKQIKEESTI